MIDLYASLCHYAEHCWPVWEQLEQLGLSGEAYAARSGSWWRSARQPRPRALRGVQPVMVASYVDYQRTAPAPVVYVEHGAGQTYDGDERSRQHPSYSSSGQLDRVVLFLVPNLAVAARRQTQYPGVPVHVVGVPKLDAWHARESRGSLTKSRAVAVTFHWDCPLVPETLSALRHQQRGLPALVQWARAHDVELLGHGHPRAWRQLAALWRSLGVEPVERFSDVLDRADVLVGDNTSALFEFASLDRPVVVMNAPWYRRDVDHGGRFWQWADVGVQCDEPGELIACVQTALVDAPEVRASRQRVVDEAYPLCDGHAAERAARAIEVTHHGDDVPGSGASAAGARGF